jgi:hypothetical protein
VREPPDLRELVGEDVPDDELRRLAHADALLRSVPGPPAELPASLTRTVASIAQPRASLWTRRRVAGALALAAAIAAVFFAFGTLAGGGGDFDERAAIPMEVGDVASEASATIRVGNPDDSGNWPLRLEVEGLEPLPKGGYYLLWLAKNGDFGVACGSFRVGDGETVAQWDVSYRLADYDEWVVTAYRPGEPRDAERPWLLTADVRL